MAQEKERKFRLKYLPENLWYSEIEQGYLILDGAKHLRIRITKYPNDPSLVDSAVIGYKTVISKEEKEEFEYHIPLTDGVQMMASTEIKLTKRRYRTKFNENYVDIDVFPDGTSWVEIEFDKPFTEIPDFCGEEITGSDEFNNIVMAIKNSKK